MSELKPLPCPFCAMNLTAVTLDMRHCSDVAWQHPPTGCIHDGYNVFGKQIPLWNRRASALPAVGDAVKHMVDRFLGWKLPENFHPDAGISFKPEFNVEYNAARGLPPQRHEPSGTNLFDATQAEEMVRYMLEELPVVPSPTAGDVERMREFDRLSLVIESAVRNADPLNHPAVLDLILANRTALAAIPTSTKGYVENIAAALFNVDFPRNRWPEDALPLPARRYREYAKAALSAAPSGDGRDGGKE